MNPINRIKRWPFPGNPVLNTLGDGEELRVEGEEMLSVSGALRMALGERDGRRIFNFLKRLAAESATKTGGGIPCITFKDAEGDFASIVEDGDEEEVDDEPD